MPFLGDGLTKMGGLGSSGNLASYIASLNPYVLYNMQQTAGTSEPNSAAGSNSIGSAGNLTLTSVTLGQTGKLGVNEAYLFDGANSRLQVANNATLAALTTWEYLFLVNPSSAGEGSVGAFFVWGTGAVNQGYYVIFNSALSSIKCGLWNVAGTSFITTTSAGISASTWSLVNIAYADSVDRKVHIYVNGIEPSYSAQPAMTGTFKPPTATLNLFNDSTQTLTFAGLGDFAGLIGGNLTSAQRLRIAQLAGV